MRVRICLFFILLLLMCSAISTKSFAADGVSQISTLQRFREVPKLYAPNFVLIGKKATFKVYTRPNINAQLVLDYGAGEKKQTYTALVNDVGIATFYVLIIDNSDFVGKSVAVDAYVWEGDNIEQKTKAVLQNESGTAASYSRVYIADDESAKGVLFTPWKALNQVIMNVDYDERSGYDPINDQIYDDTTPVYVRNMRDAQDNVREIPTDFNHSDR